MCSIFFNTTNNYFKPGCLKFPPCSFSDTRLKILKKSFKESILSFVALFIDHFSIHWSSYNVFNWHLLAHHLLGKAWWFRIWSSNVCSRSADKDAVTYQFNKYRDRITMILTMCLDLKWKVRQGHYSTFAVISPSIDTVVTMRHMNNKPSMVVRVCTFDKSALLKVNRLHKRRTRRSCSGILVKYRMSITPVWHWWLCWLSLCLRLLYFGLVCSFTMIYSPLWLASQRALWVCAFMDSHLHQSTRSRIPRFWAV